jgi:hypothetical protein
MRYGPSVGGTKTARRRRLGLLEACVIDDLSRNEIGRCLGVDHKAAPAWTITAIRGARACCGLGGVEEEPSPSRRLAMAWVAVRDTPDEGRQIEW